MKDLPAPARDALARGLEALQLPPDLQGPLTAYLELLLHWNRAYNLTSLTDPTQMVTHHLLDSLAMKPWIHGSRIADIGSGAGLPGIPLAIADPALEVVLVEAVGKKVRFQKQVILELGLKRVEAVQTRVENYRPERAFDTVISRAFAATRDFVALAGHLAKPDGRLLAMKGRDPKAELADLPAPWTVEAVHAISVPGLSAARHLVQLRRTRDSQQGQKP
ncbi:16S rRNA (guanine(527)-N(7))-methyltransferase RsmG [Thioalkalivibrio denitrificans]|uniref:Ribosomal RNA small subunit methyltransferase G n=1 Tax=Thioalkalivibrio denitrificans TaxID=108003 RepID=A0A1V3NRY7_9GAMM|nr:16S rRNA (guanine(527)-N(7))-methyltransferase RsmG [Thioalkalivibrio denitrificans]OOG27879.1 16S rRNA (guanine(527)-N(7))-methyltransferase RsmG [Thioalkalivibrio denitrificans]